MANEILKEALSFKESLEHWRVDLHRIPELGITLPQTCAYIINKLEAFGIPYRFNEEKSYIVATVGQGAPCFLIRADMDALPVEEKSGEPFASTNGCMHACGHDMHATALLGAAKILKAHEAELKGTVKLFFQSGEESFGGAKLAIEDGILEDPKVDAAFGMHVSAFTPTGAIVYGEKAFSSANGFRIIVKGKGAHGSTPEMGVDPIHIAVCIFQALEELKAREIAGMEECALTIGSFHAGAAPNVIPDTAEISGSLRTFNKEVADFTMKRIEELATGIAKAYRGSAEVIAGDGIPPTICDPALMREFAESVRGLDEQLFVAEQLHVMGSEDFSFVLQEVPGAYMAYGAGVEDKSKWRPQHSPEVVFNMDALPIAAACYAQVAMDYLEKHAK